MTVGIRVPDSQHACFDVRLSVVRQRLHFVGSWRSIFRRPPMTQPGSQGDGSAPVSRRDMLRLGAASLGAPLLGHAAPPHVLAEGAAPVRAEATPMSDFPAWDAFPAWEGEDYPDHPDPRARTVNNLKFMGLGMYNFAADHAGRFPAAATRKGDTALLSWRVAILPYIEQRSRSTSGFASTRPGIARTTRRCSRRCRAFMHRSPTRKPRPLRRTING